MSDNASSSPSPSSPAPAPASPIAERLTSLDALRGFDMFWILGGDALMRGLGKISKSPVAQTLSEQLRHAKWHGFTFYDLVFPLFLFIVGVSIVFSLERVVQKHGRAGAMKRILVRGALLFVLGVIYNGGIKNGDWDSVRYAGVLQRIAVCYVVVGTLFVLVRWRGLLAALVVALAGYWALMSFVPVRDFSLEKGRLQRLRAETRPAAAEPPPPAPGQQQQQQQPLRPSQTTLLAETAEAPFDATTTWVNGKFEPGVNLANHVDFRHLPGRKYDGVYDPEGLLSTLPSVATCLLGVFAGLLLRRRGLAPQRKVLWLMGAGLAAVLLGFLWGRQFPVNKNLWSSSFVLVAGGYSALLLGGFYQIIDVWKKDRWAAPFIWIGVNPIALYMVSSIVDMKALAERFVGGPIKAGLGAYGEIVVALAMSGLFILLAWFLYRRRIFLKV